ncbi:cell division protein FtsA [Fervidibacillus albus]|uniref:Cell division protein FtsA n=1 Tax=Fervidibacillus albus TaxID=2980026 RepID=A0A9E8LV14_9BACI|nr:cell division protein FtsA [Fervidibacillus albus]WAA10099.1 cell division protein FtsA [Fervidibacillus albus]
MKENNNIFALDIGTRSIVGIMLEEKDEQYTVKKVIVKEHKERAMLDGQIHDVVSVANLIQQVKEEMETFYGPLQEAYVAAAGRSLKTEKATASIDIKGRKLQRDDIRNLELMAVQKAEEQIIEKYREVKTNYFCVGYSVLYYYLDGEIIGNLLDQTGSEAKIEIIATFLPKIVIDSLTSALNRCGLEIAALTLEPIAAINVLIPKTMRRLNVALVDIGAGTSDIAITDEGTIINYGMVPIAGDEMTEAISDEFLLDFPLAEQAKRQLVEGEPVTFTDILGFEQTVPYEQMIEGISPAIEKLAEQISHEILQLNSFKSPKAVMLVGGGSLTPLLPELLSEKLKLPKNRVAVRGIHAIENLVFEEEMNKGPEFVTPLGIAISAKKNPIRYKTVFVNDIPVRTFEFKPLTVGECLVQAGIKISHLYGKPGLAKMITINGKAKTLSGTLGMPPELKKNGKACSIDDSVEDGDRIIARRGRDGEPTNVTLEQFIGREKFTVTINGQTYRYEPDVKVNGQSVPPKYEIKDRDQIEWNEQKTIADFISYFHQTFVDHYGTFVITVNGQLEEIPAFSRKLLKNGVEVSPNAPVNNGDHIQFTDTKHPTVEQLIFQQGWLAEETLPITFNGQPVQLTKKLTKIYRGGKELTKDDLIAPGDEITIKKEPFSPFIFQDVFRFVDFQIPKDASGKYKILRNGKEATFFDPLEPGDELNVKWEA